MSLGKHNVFFLRVSLMELEFLQVQRQQEPTCLVPLNKRQEELRRFLFFFDK